jgi:hypothetical protein
MRTLVLGALAGLALAYVAGAASAAYAAWQVTRRPAAPTPTTRREARRTWN